DGGNEDLLAGRALHLRVAEVADLGAGDLVVHLSSPLSCWQSHDSEVAPGCQALRSSLPRGPRSHDKPRPGTRRARTLPPTPPPRTRTARSLCGVCATPSAHG